MPQSIPKNQKVKRIKRGLVLMGGGAKGGYQLGVLKALAKHGIEFDAVAGTSVGGLNAALWSTGRLESGEALWRNLHRDRIFADRLPKPLSSIILPLFMLLNLIVAYFDGTLSGGLEEINKMLDKIIRRGLTCLVALLAFFCLINQQGVPFGFLMIVLGGLLRPGRLAKSEFADSLRFFYKLFAWVVGLLVLLVIWIDYPYSILIKLLISVVALFLLKILLDLPSWLYGRIVHFSSLSSFPLRREIESILDNAVLKIPTFVTMAERCSIVDPDDWFKTGSITSSPHLFVEKRFVPIYQDLNLLKNDDKTSALLTTAALPFGLVGHLEWMEDSKIKKLVDGGVADNTPIYPLLHVGCNEILVISLLTKKEENTDLLPQRWQEIQRLIDLSYLDVENLKAQITGDQSEKLKNDPPVNCPYSEPPTWPRIYEISPRKDLGSFLDGTLNFSEKKSRQNMVQGFEDGIHFLDLNPDFLWSFKFRADRPPRL